MKKHRVFIAINLPADVKKRLFEAVRRLAEKDLPIRWTKEENLHITLEFIGHTSDDEVAQICKITRETAARHKPFFVSLESITYDSTAKIPRMIWANGEISEEFKNLADNLKNSLAGFSSVGGRTREPKLHLTLGRIIQSEWRLVGNPPKIDEKINLKFEVESVEVMESNLNRGGSEYIVLESAPFKS